MKQKQQLLTSLNSRLESATSTLPLATRLEDIIPGEGLPTAEIMLIGEAPGYHETVQRRPFVGRSGQLLRKTLTEVGLKPEEVFISNIVKARPPENRDPTPQEIAAYKPYLDKEILLIDPVLMVTLGRVSMAKFLPDVKISQVHGRLHKVKWLIDSDDMASEEKTIYVLPMYHPAAGLRSTQVKESFVRDFQKVKKVVAWVKKQQKKDKLKNNIEEVLF